MKKVMNKIELYIRKIMNSSFIKSILSLSVGVVIGQVLQTIAVPFISRIYTPGQLGDYQIINSSSTIISTIVVLGMMTTIMLPEEDDEAYELGSVIFSFMSLALIAVGIVFFSIEKLYKVFEVSCSYRVSIVLLLSMIEIRNISTIFYSYVNRDKKYNILLWNPIIYAISELAIVVILGLLRFGTIGYCCGIIMGSVMSVIHMMRHTKGRVRIVSFSKMITVIKKYSRFPKYQLPTNFITTTSVQLPNQMIMKIFGSTVLGNYSMAIKILYVPVNFLAMPINRVFYRKAAEDIRNGKNIGELAFRLIKSSILIAIIPIGIVSIFGGELFEIILGNQWGDAGQYAEYLGMTALMQFCGTCLAGSFVLINKQSMSLVISILDVVFCLVAFGMASICNFTPIETIRLYSVVVFITKSINWGLFFYYTDVSVKKFILFLVYAVIIPSASFGFIKDIIFW